jgi:hypothetical protein
VAAPPLASRPSLTLRPLHVLVPPPTRPGPPPQPPPHPAPVLQPHPPHLLPRQRVLYIDIDVHHGDGVEEAFYLTDRVMTVRGWALKGQQGKRRGGRPPGQRRLFRGRAGPEGGRAAEGAQPQAGAHSRPPSILLARRRCSGNGSPSSDAHPAVSAWTPGIAPGSSLGPLPAHAPLPDPPPPLPTISGPAPAPRPPPRTLQVSFHKYGDYFFPGTGDITDVGEHNGR